MPTNALSPLITHISQLIEARTGLAAQTLFRSSLPEVLNTLANGSLSDYLHQLDSSPDQSTIWQKLIRALTIGETYFLRDHAQFDRLRTLVIPQIVRQRREQQKKLLNIWSAGCATGEEPYSIAIVLRELLADIASWTIRLIGTDMNMRALDEARHAVYRQWSFRHTPHLFAEQYFDEYDSGARLKSAIRDMVSFRYNNLLYGAPLPQLDVIFCRNVLLYIDKPVVKQIENMLFDALVPGGWLLLGQSEAIRFDRERWITHIFPGTVLYQKPADTTPLRGGEVSYTPLEVRDLEHTPIPNGNYEATYQNAVDAMRRHEPESAEQQLAEVLVHHPHHAPAHTLLACLFANRHVLPEAHAHLDAALKADPLLADAHYLKAVLHLESGDLESGDLEEARRALHAALYCQRNHPLANLMLGNLYSQLGDFEKAHRALSNARAAVAHHAPDAYISNLNDMTAHYFDALVEAQLAELE